MRRIKELHKRIKKENNHFRSLKQFSHRVIIFLTFLLFQDRLVWYCAGIWSREEGQPTQCPVSHCQRWCPSGSHPQTQVLSTGQLLIILKIIRILPKSFSYVCSLVSLQIGTFQSNISVSNPPNRSASTQRYLLCHRWTPAGLHGHPQIDRHPIYKSTERRVSLPFYYDAQTVFYSTSVVENYNTTYRGRVLWETRHLLCVFFCFSESWSCKGRAQPQTLPRRSRKQSLLWVLARANTQLSATCVALLITACGFRSAHFVEKLFFCFHSPPFPSPILFLFFLPWFLCRFCWCRNLWGES